MRIHIALLPLSLFLQFVEVSISTAVPSYDVTADWSDATNPAGPWRYCEGGNPLPFQMNAWQGLSGDFATAQPAWTSEDNQISSLPAIFKSSAVISIPHDWQAGDVVVHTTDSFNGAGFGPAGIEWTSPFAGTIDVTGAVWMGRDIGRGNHWSLLRNGVELTGGDIASGDLYSRSSPFLFSAGSGGAAAGIGLVVNPGDRVELRLTKTSSAGDYVGVRMTITATAVVGVPGDAQLPPPASFWVGGAILLPSGGINIPFGLRRSGTVQVELFDVAGHRVRAWSSGNRSAGTQSVVWDGRNDAGRIVRAGVYFYRLTSGGDSASRRVVLTS